MPAYRRALPSHPCCPDIIPPSGLCSKFRQLPQEHALQAFSPLPHMPSISHGRQGLSQTSWWNSASLVCVCRSAQIHLLVVHSRVDPHPLHVCAGAGKCIFLFVHSAQLLVLSGEQASRMPAIYLDAHGEDDPGLHRYGPALTHGLLSSKTKQCV